MKIYRLEVPEDCDGIVIKTVWAYNDNTYRRSPVLLEDMPWYRSERYYIKRAIAAAKRDKFIIHELIVIRCGRRISVVTTYWDFSKTYIEIDNTDPDLYNGFHLYKKHAAGYN